jgi:hypothetical protein
MAKFLSILIISFMSISSLYAQSSTTTQHSDGTYSYEFDMGNGSSNTMNSDGSWSTSTTNGGMTTTYESDGSYSFETEYE